MRNEIENLLDEGDNIKSVQDYVKWVRKWRRLHEGLVSRIQFLKGDLVANGFSIRKDTMTNEFPKEDAIVFGIVVMAHDQKNISIHSRLACDMYDARAGHKEMLKKGVYGVEVGRGHNSLSNSPRASLRVIL